MHASRSTTVSGGLDARVLRIAAVCVLGVMITDLDSWIVIVAQRTFARQFGSPPAIVAWTLTGYTLALAAVIPLTGWAADRFGTKRLFLAAVVLFGVGSLLCAAAPNIALLVTFRVVQALAGGVLLPLTFIIVTREAGAHRIGRLMVVLAVPMMLPAVFAPMLGGWLIGSFSWRWIFLINPPICLVVFLLALAVLPDSERAITERLDFIGLLLLSPSLATLLYGISSIPRRGTTQSWHPYFFVSIGCVLLAGFLFHALYRPRHPLVDLRLFGNRTFAAASATMLLYLAASAGIGLLIPSYLQQALGQTPLQSGVHLMPQALGLAATMPIAGYFVDKRGPRNLALGGLALIVTGMVVFAYAASRHCAYWPMVLVALALMGMGMGCTSPAISGAAIGTLKPHQVSRGSTLMGVNPPIAISTGAALMSVILTAEFNRSPYLSAVKRAATSPGDPAKTDVPLDLSAPPQQAFPADFMSHAANDLSHAYAVVGVVAACLAGSALIPAWLLPNRPVQAAGPAALLAGSTSATT